LGRYIPVIIVLADSADRAGSGASSSVDTIMRGNARFHDAELPERPDETTTGQAA